MKRLAIALFIVLFAGSLAACDPVSRLFGADPLTKDEFSQLSTEAKFFKARGDFNVLLGTVNAYAGLEFCSESVVVGCADASLVIQLTDMAEKAQAALAEAEQFMLADNVARAQIAVAAINSLVLTRLLGAPGG